MRAQASTITAVVFSARSFPPRRRGGLLRRRGAAPRRAGPPAPPLRSTPAPTTDPNRRAAVLELERALGTRVRVVGSEKRGKIEISYFSPEDLNLLHVTDDHEEAVETIIESYEVPIRATKADAQ